MVSRGDHVEDTGGNVCFLRDQAAEEGGGPRRVRSRLENDSIARCKGRADLGQIEIDRDIPGRDGSDDAHRFPAHCSRLRLSHESNISHGGFVGVVPGQIGPVGHRFNVMVELEAMSERDRGAGLGDDDGP